LQKRKRLEILLEVKIHGGEDKAGTFHNPYGENSHGSPDRLCDRADLAGGELTLVRNLVNIFYPHGERNNSDGSQIEKNEQVY
jgi:hypothetical protein